MNNQKSNGKTVNHKDLAEQYPTEAQVLETRRNQMNPDNHFRNHSKDEIAKRYVQMHVLMEYVNQCLELPPAATVEQLARRIHDLVYANGPIPVAQDPREDDKQG